MTGCYPVWAGFAEADGEAATSGSVTSFAAKVSDESPYEHDRHEGEHRDGEDRPEVCLERDGRSRWL